MPPPPPPPELGDDLLREIFLRLPPDDPASLLRASVACKRFRRIITDPAFCRRYQELHRTPSVAGLLLTTEVDAPYASRFVPTNAFGRPAARDFPGRLALDCRHGRVLLVSASPSLRTQLNYDLVVWDPLTDEERCLPRLSPPPTVVCGGSHRHLNAAVLCATPAEACCDHRECHGGHFRVVFVWSRGCGDSISLLTSARVYSSETGDWSEPISVMHPSEIVLDRMPCPSLLVGDTLYFRFGFMHALEYQLDTHCLSVVGGPPRSMMFETWAISLMSMEDGGLGCMDVEEDESGTRIFCPTGHMLSFMLPSDGAQRFAPAFTARRIPSVFVFLHIFCNRYSSLTCQTNFFRRGEQIGYHHRIPFHSTTTAIQIPPSPQAPTRASAYTSTSAIDGATTFEVASLIRTILLRFHIFILQTSNRPSASTSSLHPTHSPPPGTHRQVLSAPTRFKLTESP